MATRDSLLSVVLALLALAMGHVQSPPPTELERDVDQCALGFACGALAALWDSQMQHLGNRACLVDGQKSFREGQKKQEEDDATPFRKCARDKLHQQLILHIDQAEQADASNRKKCIQSSVRPCLQACHQKVVSDQIACIRSRGDLCTNKAVFACKPPKEHLPAGAYSAAMKECGYRPPSISSSDNMSGVVSNMACNIEGGELMEKFLIEGEEAMGEHHLLILVEVDAIGVVRMEIDYFEQQVSAALKKLQQEKEAEGEKAKQAESEAKEEEKLQEKADTDIKDAGKEIDDESEKEPEAEPEGKGGGEDGAEGAAEEAGAMAWSILKAPFNAQVPTTRTSSHANLSDANPEAKTVERQSLHRMNKQDDKNVDKSVDQAEGKWLKQVKAQYNAIFPVMQCGLACLLAWARPRPLQQFLSSCGMNRGTPFSIPLLSSAA